MYAPALDCLISFSTMRVQIGGDIKIRSRLAHVLQRLEAAYTGVSSDHRPAPSRKVMLMSILRLPSRKKKRSLIIDVSLATRCSAHTMRQDVVEDSSCSIQLSHRFRCIDTRSAQRGLFACEMAR
jgi:hypothetical protein